MSLSGLESAGPIVQGEGIAGPRGAVAAARAPPALLERQERDRPQKLPLQPRL